MRILWSAVLAGSALALGVNSETDQWAQKKQGWGGKPVEDAELRQNKPQPNDFLAKCKKEYEKMSEQEQERCKLAYMNKAMDELKKEDAEVRKDEQQTKEAMARLERAVEACKKNPKADQERCKKAYAMLKEAKMKIEKEEQADKEIQSTERMVEFEEKCVK